MECQKCYVFIGGAKLRTYNRFGTNDSDAETRVVSGFASCRLRWQGMFCDELSTRPRIERGSEARCRGAMRRVKMGAGHSPARRMNTRSFVSFKHRAQRAFIT